MTVVVYYVGSERIRILGETKKFDEKIYAYIFVIFLIPHFWIPFVGWGKQNDSIQWHWIIESMQILE